MNFQAFEGYFKGLESQIRNVQDWLALDDGLTNQEFGRYEKDLKLLEEQARSFQVDTPDENVRQWLEVCAPKHYRWFNSILQDFFLALVSARTRKPDIEKLEDFSFILEDMTSTIKSLWRGDEAPGPARFQYEGFKIQNPDRMSDIAMRQTLDSVDYLKAKFKKRGLEDVLYEGLTAITLFLNPKSPLYGMYDPNHKMIVLYSQKIKGQKRTNQGTNRWVDEVFMHEFGHYIHMNYITSEARKFWDGTWAPVEEAEKDSESWSLTYQERLRFWKLLEKARFDIASVRRKLKSPDKEKFLGWMLQANFIKVGKDGSRVGLTPEGKEFQGFFQDPDEYTRKKMLNKGWTQDPKRERDKYMDRAKKDLFLPYENTILDLMLDSNSQPMALLLQTSRAESSKAQVTEYWGTPSDYGKTNVIEDFAESFVQYIETPEKMTENNLYRMKRTLWLSGFGGKPVQRLAVKLAERYIRSPHAT